jgi:hypothetical protein
LDAGKFVGIVTEARLMEVTDRERLAFRLFRFGIEPGRRYSSRPTDPAVTEASTST